MASHGFVAPTRPYDGKFGLFDSHLHDTKPSPEKIIEGLGTHWHLPDTAIKPYPVCHFIHGCIDAALDLHGKFAVDDVEQIIAWLAKDTMPIVAEPALAKQHASTDYEAKFSAQYCVAKTLQYGRFGLGELTPAALSDVITKQLALKVVCRVDPATQFPKYYSGGVTVVLKDGRKHHSRVPINKGAGPRALSAADIQAKFLANATLWLDTKRAERAMHAILDLEARSVRSVVQTLQAA